MPTSHGLGEAQISHSRQASREESRRTRHGPEESRQAVGPDLYEFSGPESKGPLPTAFLSFRGFPLPSEILEIVCGPTLGLMELLGKLCELFELFLF